MFGFEVLLETFENERGYLLRLLKDSSFVTDIFEVISSTLEYKNGTHAEVKINLAGGLRSIVNIVVQNGLGWGATTLWKASRM